MNRLRRGRGQGPVSAATVSSSSRGRWRKTLVTCGLLVAFGAACSTASDLDSSHDGASAEGTAARVAAAQTSPVALLVEIEHKGNLISFYEGLDPQGPTFFVTEQGPIGHPSVVPSDVERSGPAAVWDYLRPGLAPPQALSDAISRAAARPRDPLAERIEANEIREAYEAAHPNLSGVHERSGGEDMLARTTENLVWFRKFVGEIGMYPYTSSDHHRTAMTVDWNHSAWYETGSWEEITVLTAYTPRLNGLGAFSLWWLKKIPTGTVWQVALNPRVRPNHWFRIRSWSKGKLYWRTDAKEGYGDLIGLAFFARNKEFYGTTPPTSPPTCSYSTVIKTGECYDIYGNRSWLSDYPLATTGCGSTEQTAVNIAKYLAGTERCLEDAPVPGCCLYQINTIPGVCLCQ